MLNTYQYSVAERFLRYVQCDTQSDPSSLTFPSTVGQRKLAELLVAELKEMGIKDAEMDDYGYVYATVLPTVKHPVPTLCFCSHLDTAPDCSGFGVKPLYHKAYKGQDIVLPDDPEQIISPGQYPYLLQKVGDDIITASGTTLLGADDKSGIAVIMDMVQYLQQHPSTEHGTIGILFTPDEEIGKGTLHADLKKLGASFGYTLDGGAAGDLEDETFSADGVVVTIHGISAHPGDAKGKMVNAMKVAAELLAALPKEEWSPESTSKREGFVHPVKISGEVEIAEVHFIVRDFETANLGLSEARLKQLVQEACEKYPGATYTYKVAVQYRNMGEVLKQVPEVVDYAREAMERVGLQVRNEPIRGGTDGSRLSFMGLPCPNIFTGMQNLHSKHEWISVQDMQKSVAVLVELVKIWAEKSKPANG